MGVHEEPSYIEGKINPIFGEVNLVKESELPITQDFRHEHFWEKEDGQNVKCQCGKGKILSEELTVRNGKIILK